MPFASGCQQPRMMLRIGQLLHPVPRIATLSMDAGEHDQCVDQQHLPVPWEGSKMVHRMRASRPLTADDGDENYHPWQHEYCHLGLVTSQIRFHQNRQDSVE